METMIFTNNIGCAADIIVRGGLVAVPTETVYGLAANGLDPEAVARIYDVKGRPEAKPISLLVSGFSAVEKLCADIPERACLLAETFWPGPLTMILKKRQIVPDIVTSGGLTVGVRCPAHPLTLELISACGRPLAAPSANISGMPSPKNAQDVLRTFSGRIDAVIDGGECSVGIESTIVDLTADAPRILRQGGLARENIEEIIGRLQP